MFNVSNKQVEVSHRLFRACDKCAHLYSNEHLEKDKQAILTSLTNLCINYLAQKNKLEQQTKKCEAELPTEDGMAKEKKQSEDKMIEMQLKIDAIAKRRKQMEAEIAALKEQ